MTAACDAPSMPRRPDRIVAEDAVDLPLTGSTAEDLRIFKDGDALFDAVFGPADGLGPLFIRSQCSACHSEGGRGPGLVEKMAPADPSVGGDSLPYGPTVRPYMTVPATTPLVPPEGGWTQPLKRTLRLGPALWGRGYVEAIADAEIERVAAEQAARPDGIHGRINRVTYHSQTAEEPGFEAHQVGQTGLIGRFGLKGRVATITDFTADAFQGDMGITSPLRPGELTNPDGLTDDNKTGVDISGDIVRDVAGYVRRIEIPRRDPAAATATARALFEAAQCATCHVPALRTRPDYPIALLADVDAPVFSDLLLHDMGDDLADGVADEGATGREWRTTPLIGLRFFGSYLHDARAHTIEEAITMHAGPGSQGNEAVARYQALSAAERAELLRFVSSL
jgi:CxxC motif-containing protein (DUF1111 family)